MNLMTGACHFLQEGGPEPNSAKPRPKPLHSTAMPCQCQVMLWETEQVPQGDRWRARPPGGRIALGCSGQHWGLQGTRH